MRARDIKDLGPLTDERRRLARAADAGAWQRAMAHVQPLVHPHAWVPARPKPLVLPRRGRTGRLDLHGLSVAEAHRQTLGIIEIVDAKGVVIVTGKSGAIRREFIRWLEPKASICLEELADGGAFRVRRRKL